MARRPRRSIGVPALLLIGGFAWFLYAYWAPFPYRALVWQSARHMRLDPFLVAGVVRVESRFQPQVVSRRGAVGLMQIMPSTAVWIQRQLGERGTPDLDDPAVNLRLGTWYLRYLNRRFDGNWVLTLAAYNGGPQTVERWLGQGTLKSVDTNRDTIPYPETRHFVQRVFLFRQLYRWMYGWWPIRPHW